MHPKSFEEFWPFYLAQHQHASSRALHYLGTLSAIAWLAHSAWLQNPARGLAALLLGYGPAWIGHFLLERNRPATFKYPLWSLRGDFKMLGKFLTGKMGSELAAARKSPFWSEPTRTPRN